MRMRVSSAALWTMELDVPRIVCQSGVLSKDDYQRLRSVSPDPRHLSPQPPPSIDSEMSTHSAPAVRTQPAPRYEFDPITGQMFRVDKPPNDHMLLSVLSLLFCMIFPTTFCAILSIVYSFQVDILWRLNMIKESRSASTSARNWAVATFICGIAIVMAVIFISTLWAFSSGAVYNK